MEAGGLAPRVLGILAILLLVDAPASAQDVPGASSAPTYADAIEPLLARECVGCHRPGGAGPFSLDSYDAALRYARAIRRVVTSGEMPPWPPEAPPGTFVGQPRISDADVETLRTWIEAGAPRGGSAANEREGGGWEADPDLIVALPPYSVPADGPDLYPSLVATIPSVGERWVERAEIRLDDGSALHHMVMRFDTTSSSRDLASRTAGPDFDRLEGTSDAMLPSGDFLGWAPGQRTLPGVEGIAWRLPAGADLVAELHLHPSGEESVVAVEIAFFFSATPPEVEPLVIGLMADELDIPAGDDDYLVHDTLTLPVPVEVLSVYPHAHFLGDDLTGLAILPTGEALTLIRVPSWDFNWQGEYQFVEPVSLPAGTMLVQEFTFDNSAGNPHNPSDPPRRVRRGNASTDEMAELILRVLPQTEADRRTLVTAFDRRNRRRTAERRANEAFALGKGEFAGGDFEGAVRSFQESLRYRPNDVAALTFLSRALLAAGDPEAARLAGDQAVVASDRADATALGALAAAQSASGAVLEAIDTAEAAHEIARRNGQSELTRSISLAIDRYRAKLRR